MKLLYFFELEKLVLKQWLKEISLLKRKVKLPSILIDTITILCNSHYKVLLAANRITKVFFGNLEKL